MVTLKIKRVYDAPSEADGYRVVVDRLWPRGISKDDLKVDIWLRDVAPSDELRKWFGHDPAKWQGFRSKYTQELNSNKEFEKLLDLVRERKGHAGILGTGHRAQPGGRAQRAHRKAAEGLIPEPER